MCRARPAEVPPLLNRPKGFGGPQPTGWPQPKALLNKRVPLIGAGRRLNVWRLLSGPNGSYIKRLYIRPRSRAKLCIAVVSEDRSSALDHSTCVERLIFAAQADPKYSNSRKVCCEPALRL